MEIYSSWNISREIVGPNFLLNFWLNAEPQKVGRREKYPDRAPIKTIMEEKVINTALSYAVTLFDIFNLDGAKAKLLKEYKNIRILSLVDVGELEIIKEKIIRRMMVYCMILRTENAEDFRTSEAILNFAFNMLFLEKNHIIDSLKFLRTETTIELRYYSITLSIPNLAAKKKLDKIYKEALKTIGMVAFKFTLENVVLPAISGIVL
ncbi:hypothetical protein K7432_011161 [Basidiobolus ranarum]|uniref:Uncharacterized protein n=1 Tax=Basidiobolus ranarum TaxID=34480 RepID=A0ABR2WMR8_9FUNG